MGQCQKKKEKEKKDGKELKKEITGEKQLEQTKTRELNRSNDMKCFCPSRFITLTKAMRAETYEKN